MQKTFLTAVAMVFAFSLLPAHAALTSDTHVEMMREGHMLFIDAKHPTIVMQGVIETLKTAGWQELEVQPTEWAPGPWCVLEISETGGTIYSKCYTPQMTGIEVRHIFGTFNHTTKTVDVSGISALLDRTYADAMKAEDAVGISREKVAQY